MGDFNYLDHLESMTEQDFSAPKQSGKLHVLYPDTIEIGNRVKTLSTKDNVTALCSALGLEPSFNTMTGEPELQGINFDKYQRACETESYLISNAEKTGLPKCSIAEHFSAACAGNRFHPVGELLNAGAWDGVSRVDAVLNSIQTEDQDYSNSVLKSFLIGCAASAVKTGFQTKLVPILQGDQDDMKTAALSRIFSLLDGAFAEGLDLDPTNKDSVIRAVSSWVVELGELERTTAKGQGALKAFISAPSDTYRPPYGKTNITKRAKLALLARLTELAF